MVGRVFHFHVALPTLAGLLADTAAIGGGASVGSFCPTAFTASCLPQRSAPGIIISNSLYLSTIGIS